MQTTFNIIIGGRILAQYKMVYPSTTSVVYFYIDNLGSRRVVISSTVAVVDRYRYSAWSVPTQDTGSDDYRSFTGKDHDATGLIYFNARYYDPIVGRFLTEDPSRKGNNWYAYCESNPINRTDPTGMKEIIEGGTTTPSQPAQPTQQPTTNQPPQTPQQNSGSDNSTAAIKQDIESMKTSIDAWKKQLVSSPQLPSSPQLQPWTKSNQIDLNNNYNQGIKVEIGLSGNVLLYGGSAGFATAAPGAYANSSQVNYSLIGASVDLSIGSTSNMEITFGPTKYLSVGVLLNESAKGPTTFAGIALHFGPGLSLPITISKQ